MLHPTFSAQLPFVVTLLKKHKIKSAYAFGSIVNGQFNEESDIDLLIDFDDSVGPLEKGELWWNLYDKLRDVFEREVDLLVGTSLKNPYLIEDIEEKKLLIYAA